MCGNIYSVLKCYKYGVNTQEKFKNDYIFQ